MTTTNCGVTPVTWLLVLICSIVSLCMIMPASAFDGPLRVKNQFPLFMHLDSPCFESAATVNSFSTTLFYSSVFMNRQSAQWKAQLDMEIAELNLRYTRQISNLVELGVEVPILALTSGFMDPFLNTFHSTFGFADYGRQSRPGNSFLYQVQRRGSVIIRGEDNGIGLGDIKLSAKKLLFDKDPLISIKADVELPTGAASKGYGSGSLDGGLSVLIDKRLGENIISYYNMGVIFPGRLKAVEPIHINTSGYGGVGLEALIYQKFSLLGQVMVQTSPFPKTGIGTIDRTSVLFTLGGRYVKGKEHFEFSFTEDPNTAGAADVTITLSYKTYF
ncbi:MAG: DUF3187 family protein [Nitrospirae bacterium]|nr:DUF3187 family protein [Nitrospirota bacterium]